MAGEGVPSDDVMLSHGNFQKLVKGAAKNKPVVLTLSGGEIEANATTGTGIMEGGKGYNFKKAAASTFKKLAKGKVVKEAKRAGERLAKHGLEKGESMGHEKIASLGSGAEMSGGKAYNFKKAFESTLRKAGKSKVVKEAKRAGERLAKHGLEKGESMGHERIASMGSGMSGGSIGPRRSSVAPNIGAGGNLLCPMDSKPHLANFHMFTQLPPALVPSGMFGRGLYH